MSVSLMTTKKLTKAEKRAEKIEREAQEFAERQADVLVRKSCHRDDPMYAGLSEEEFKAEQRRERERIRDILLAMLRYRFGERGQIEERITDELTRRCGNKKLAQELVRMIDCQTRDKKNLMDILVKFLGNSEICRGLDVRREWEEFVEPYLKPELVSVLHDLRDKRRQILEAKKRIIEAERRREVAEQQAAELTAEIDRLRGEGAGAGAAGSKRSAMQSGEDRGSGSSQDEGKRARGAGAGR